MHRVIRFIITGLSVLLITGCKQEKKDTLSLFAVRYGTSSFYGKNIFIDETGSGYYLFAWMFYVAGYNDKTILIDCGFRDEGLKEYFRIEYRDPLDILTEMGIPQEEITDIIVTHNHFDHIGNVERFPAARIIIQEDELASYLKGQDNSISVFLRQRKEEGMIETFRDEYVVYDLFRIEKIGGHSRGSSIVRFRWNEKEYLLTGDESYLYRNIEEERGVGTVYDTRKNREFLAILKEEKATIYTFHDPSIVPEGMDYKQLIP